MTRAGGGIPAVDASKCGALTHTPTSLSNTFTPNHHRPAAPTRWFLSTLFRNELMSSIQDCSEVGSGVALAKSSCADAAIGALFEGWRVVAGCVAGCPKLC